MPKIILFKNTIQTPIPNLTLTSIKSFNAAIEADDKVHDEAMRAGKSCYESTIVFPHKVGNFLFGKFYISELYYDADKDNLDIRLTEKSNIDLSLRDTLRFLFPSVSLDALVEFLLGNKLDDKQSRQLNEVQILIGIGQVGGMLLNVLTTAEKTFWKPFVMLLGKNIIENDQIQLVDKSIIDVLKNHHQLYAEAQFLSVNPLKHQQFQVLGEQALNPNIFFTNPSRTSVIRASGTKLHSGPVPLVDAFDNNQTRANTTKAYNRI